MGPGTLRVGLLSRVLGREGLLLKLVDNGNKMETTIVFRGYIGIVEKNMETTI